MVPLVTGILIARKLPAIVTLFCAVVFACAAMLAAQPEMVARVAGVEGLDFMSGFKGVLMTCFGPTAIPTGTPQLDELVATRGMAGMLNTVWLIMADARLLANQPWRGEYVPGPCTHRPSSHGSRECLKFVTV